MVIERDELVHVVYRALHEASSRRHFAGRVIDVEGAICRLQGFVFVFDQKSGTFAKKAESRVSIIDLAESGYIVNIIDKNVVLENLVYEFIDDIGLIMHDGNGYSLNINEFGLMS